MGLYNRNTVGENFNTTSIFCDNISQTVSNTATVTIKHQYHISLNCCRFFSLWGLHVHCTLLSRVCHCISWAFLLSSIIACFIML